MTSRIPLFFLFLLGVGILQSPVSAEEEDISDDSAESAESIEVGEEDVTAEGGTVGGGGGGGVTPIKAVSNSTTNILPLDDVRSQIENNAASLAHLTTVLAQLLEILAQNPCSENGFTNQVADAMEDGFNSTLSAFRQVQQTMKLFKLVSWRIDYINSMDVPELKGDGPCPLPFFMLNGECIYVETKVRRSFRDAKQTCLVLGGFLAEPSDLKGFAEYIHKMDLGRDKEVYIGGVDPGKTVNWRWLSGDVIENIPWQVDSPNTDDRKYCLSVKDRHYRDINCSYLRMYTCERAT